MVPEPDPVGRVPGSGRGTEPPTSPLRAAQPGAVVLVVILLVLSAVVLLVYLPAVQFDFLNYDDPDYVTENPHVLQGLTGESVKWAFTATHAFNWHPVTWLSHMLDVELFGTGPAGPHLVNVLLHAANALLVLWLLVRMTGRLWPGAFVAAFFALHPLRVESVAWVSERKDVLSTFFGLLTLLFYVLFAQAQVGGQNDDKPDADPGRKKKARFYYAIALAWFALGLMSKPMLVTWPFLMLLLDYWPLGRLGANGSPIHMRLRRLVIEKLPFFALTVASSAVTYIVQKQGAAVQSWLPLWARLENAFVSYARYLGKIFWPVNLAVPYPHPGKWPGYIVLLAFFGILLVSLMAWQLRRRRPYLFVGWFWFVGTLVPVIGLVQVGLQAMADRYTYFPSIGVFLVLCWFAAELVAKHPKAQIAAVGAGLILAGGLAMRTSDQLAHWRNTETLFVHTVRCTKNNADAMSALGNYKLKLGRVEEALDWYRRAFLAVSGLNEFGTNAAAMFLDPSPTNVAFMKFKMGLKASASVAEACAQVLNNIGFALARLGRADEAILWYRAALEVKPGYVFAMHNLAVELANRGDHANAIKLFTTALAAAPNESRIHLGLARSLKAIGEYARAIQHFRKALGAFPRDASVHEHLGVCLAETGEVNEAIKHYLAALELDPRLFKTRNNLGAALLSLGQLDAAIQQFRAVLESNPDYAAAHENLGIALAAKGEYEGAVIHFRRAIELGPALANTHFNLANVLVQQRKLHEAVAEYKEALRLDPNHVPALCNLGGVMIELGERAEAAQYLRKALELAPEFAPARELLKLAEQQP
ncbi:MAG: tetratricopeptide repeat protein [Verrucomicrobiales bacterium]|nr:tetratricopeptide repeat protein [Verrucomicrobiales bacterium]